MPEPEGRTPPPRPVPEGLVEAFLAYEQALMSNDVEALDRLFAPGPTTLRGDAAGLLVGHDAISEFRGSRGGAPARVLKQTHVQVVDDDHALVVAVTELARGGRGQQTQLWARLGHGWAVTAAHVSVPAPALDSRVWRVVGSPLLSGSPDGPLQGQGVAVKDLYAVAGQRVGAGNPTWLARASPEPRHAEVVHALLDAGADLVGIAQTDELAYSLAGTNAHTGAPPNPRAPYRVPGGSSSGSATAVSLGQASIGLGTDTGGSIRVPAAYQGLHGLRTTHGAVDRSGLLALAPSFDTVGWLTRDADLLQAVGDVLLPPASVDTGSDLVVVDALLDLARPDVVAALSGWLDDLHGDLVVRRETWPLAEHAAWLTAFQTWQGWEAWATHGRWLEGRLDVLGPDVRARFETASRVTADDARAARGVLDEAARMLRDLVGDRVLVLPSASSVAPRLGESLAPAREATLRLTCLAGIAGLPALSLPLTTAADLPCGVCLVAGPGRDRDLLSLARDTLRSPTGGSTRARQ